MQHRTDNCTKLHEKGLQKNKASVSGKIENTVPIRIGKYLKEERSQLHYHQNFAPNYR
jgi:hypothetical protein